MRISDWSSDVCSSDLILLATLPGENSVTAKSRNEAARRVTRNSASLRAVKEIISRRGPAASCLAHRQLVAEHAVGRMHAETDDRSEEPTSELQSLMRISYAVFCLKKNKKLVYD